MARSTIGQSTGRFIDGWAYVGVAMAAVMLLALIVQFPFIKPLLSQDIQVTPGQSLRLKPIAIKPGGIGALRVDVVAKIPTNRWLTYDVKIEDLQGKTLAVGRKRAWRESGIWREEGESGTWNDDNLAAGLDLQATQDESIVVAIAVEEYSTTRSARLTEPVRFRVKVDRGVIDSRYLWGGFWGACIVAVLGLFAVRSHGQFVINAALDDSAMNVRTIVGGRDQLLQVTIRVQADETAPQTVNCRLILKDGMGQRLYNPTLPIHLARVKDSEGEIQGARGKTSFYLLLKRRSSYGFHVDIIPDHSIDYTQLKVKEGVKTLSPVEIVSIEG